MMRLRILGFVSALLAVLAVSGAVSYAQAPAWPTRSVRFIVPFGPGAAADIGARLFAEKLSERWGQPVVVENRPGGDSIIAITAFLSANDDHVLLYMPSGNFTVHPFLHSKLPYDPNDLNPIVRTSNTILAVALAKSSPYNTIREFTEAARANPGKFNSGLVPGLTEFTFWAYLVRSNNSSEVFPPFTLPLGGDDSGARPFAHGIEPVCRGECSHPKGTAGRCPSPDNSARHGNAGHIRSGLVAASVHQ